MKLDDYERASDILLDALQIARINLGLYSAEQIQLLRLLIEYQTKAQDWRSVDDFYELEYLISSRAFSPRDNEYLDTLGFYGAWKLRVIQENLFNQSDSPDTYGGGTVVFKSSYFKGGARNGFAE